MSINATLVDSAINFATKVNSSEFFVGILGGIIAGLLVPWLVIMFRYMSGLVLIFRKEANIAGVYDCEYYIPWKPDGENVIYERIVLFKLGKHYYGFLINNSDDPRYRKLEKPGLRLKGEVFIYRNFIGWWIHPYTGDNTHGAFNIEIDVGGKVHQGKWNGESTTYNKILEGRWIWKRTGVHYSVFKLIKNRFFGY
ncbi:hypothetical protein [Maridesulfovibrio sp.]|uniref:hypothetical protein n=1 Tax=Maridesulfovibrio sp. TaxID=2795000 RepID=UPI0029C9E0A0|nr:hypothetical protein [Maridesulfovibrio sp.]